MEPYDDAAKPSMEQLYDEIRQRAYEVYLERLSTGAEGDELTDWIAAESEVRQKYGL